MSKRFGFFKTDNTISKYPQRDFNVAYTIAANSDVVNFNITSNLTANTVLNYEIPGFDSSDFVEPLSGTVTLDSNGNASFSRTLKTKSNYTTTNLSSYLILKSYANTVIGYSNPLTIAPITPVNVTVSGANVTTANGNTIYKITSNTTAIVNSLGDSPNILPIYAIIVGGGGAGGAGYEDQFGGRSNIHSGGGGGSGQVLEVNTTITGLFGNSSTLPITIGAGGVCTFGVSLPSNVITISATDLSNGQGKSTTFGNYTAVGGGLGLARNGAAGGGGASYYQSGNIVGIGSVEGNGGYRSTINRTDILTTLWAGGGGGGANSSGSNAKIITGTLSKLFAQGGDGGTAFTSNALGYSVTLAGGGGGGGYLESGSNVAGLGGGGGAGNGGYGTDTTAPGQNAQPNTGSGGGGATGGQTDGPPGPYEEQFVGGSGGSGVVYFAFNNEIRKLISTANLSLSSPYTANALTIATNTSINVVPVSYAGGTAPYTFSITPSLPTGAVFNTQSARITGNVTSNVAQTTYTITLTDGANTTLNSNVKIAFSS